MNTAVIREIPESMLTDVSDHVVTDVSDPATSPSPRATLRDGHGPPRPWTAPTTATGAVSTVRHDVKVPGPSGLKDQPAWPSSYENKELYKGERRDLLNENIRPASLSSRCSSPMMTGGHTAHPDLTDKSARARLIGYTSRGPGPAAFQDLLSENIGPASLRLQSMTSQLGIEPVIC